MSDAKDSELTMLKRADNKVFSSSIDPMLIPDEMICRTYQFFAFGVVFTNKRIVIIKPGEMVKTQTEYVSLPFNRIQAYSIAASNGLGFNSGLTIWCTGLGSIKLGFASKAAAFEASEIISMYVL